MVIQIERISAHRVRAAPRCSAVACTAAAAWLLLDRDMPTSHDASVGERLCCTAHIAAAYAILRGAHVVAMAGSADLSDENRRDDERIVRPRRTRAAIAFAAGMRVGNTM